MKRGQEADKIWVTVSRTVNTGNYQNVKIEMGESQTVPGYAEDKDIQEMRMDLAKSLMEGVDELADDIDRN